MTINEKYSIDGDNIERPQLPPATTKLRALNTSIDPAILTNTAPAVTELLGKVLPPNDHLADAANKVLDGEDPSESMAKYTAAVNSRERRKVEGEDEAHEATQGGRSFHLLTRQLRPDRP